MSSRTAIVAGALLVVAASGLVSGDASGVILTGSLRTAVYAQESRQADLPFAGLNAGSLEARSVLLETVRLDARRLGVDWLSMHTAFTATNVLTDESLRDTRFRLYRFYLQRQARMGGFRCESRLGRHWVTAGVGTGTLDGLSAALRRGGNEFVAYVGTLGTDRIGRTDRFWSLDSPDDSRAFGGRLRVAPQVLGLDPRIAVSFRQTQRTPHEELVTDTRRFGVHGDVRLQAPGDPAERSLLHDLRLWGDWRRDILELDLRGRRNLQTAGGLEYLGRGNGWAAWVTYEQRLPDFRATSFFSSFAAEPVDEVRAGVGVPVTKDLRVNVDGDLVSFEGDENEQGFRFMVSGYGLTLGYRFHGGYGGDLSGLIFYGHREITEKLSLDASLNLTSYEYESETDISSVQPVDDTATAGILAATWRFLHNLSVTAQVEGMENAAFDRDVRFLGFVDWRFRTGL